MKKKTLALAALSLCLAGSAFSVGQSETPKNAVDPSLYSGLSWRNIGPFRAGRVSAVSGVIGQPGVFYAGMPNGGLWKTTNAGITFEPIFDDIKTASSIGSVAVAPSDPNVVYVGLGDGTTGGNHNEGDGVYKSTDAGKTWTHIGLSFARQIPRIIVDPKNPDIVFAGVLGNARKLSPERGGYRSTDGGKTWTKTLVTDYRTGVQEVSYAYDVPNVIFATTNRRVGTTAQGNDGSKPSDFKGTSIVKSTDGGVTWSAVKGEGLPSTMSGRTSICVAQNTNAKRVFYSSNAGLWRSDDGGDTWTQMAKEDRRIRNGQGGYNCGVFVNTKDPNTVIVFNTCSYISKDGGKTFTGFKGAPGGDDPQQAWLDPTDSSRMVFGVDQGVAISLDSGGTWSGWYNIANGQFYHIAVSNTWPYWIYANMQDSGCIGMSSRGILGQITTLDWRPNPGWEWGSITVDPRDPNTIFATGQANDVMKQSVPTGQWVSISPDNDPKLQLRHDFNQPILFSPANPRELMLGYQYLMSSTDGGKTWKKISPDLTKPKGYVPPAPEPAKDAKKADAKAKVAPKEPAKRTNEREPEDQLHSAFMDDFYTNRKDAMERAQEEMEEEGQRGGGGGAISSLSPSSLDNGIIWAGISNGTIKLTKDHGRTWDDVNIIGSRRSIACIEASHTDRAKAYAVITTNSEPIVYRTKDFGATWTKIVTGLPTDEVTGSWANFIRADTKKDGLLFLGTESHMYVSFNDGDTWQSLALNSPNTSYRDAVIKGNDLVVGTYGRSFWILDDISPLREVAGNIGKAHLFKPGEAVRVRRNVNQNTPMPPETPHSLNAPPGAILYYYLGTKPSSEISIDISDRSGKVIRHYSSAPIPPAKEEYHPIPEFWKEIPKPLPTEVGTNRVNWDLRYENPPAFGRGYDISANPGLTPLSPQGPLVLPGTYKVTLTVDGQKYTQEVKVVNDPGSPGRPGDLAAQHKLQMSLLKANEDSMTGLKTLASIKEQIAAIEKGKVTKEATDAIAAFTKVVDNLGKSGTPASSVGTPTFNALQTKCIAYLAKMEFGDLAPSEPLRTGIQAVLSDLALLQKDWKVLTTQALPTLNAALAKSSLPAVTLTIDSK